MPTIRALQLLADRELALVRARCAAAAGAGRGAAARPRRRAEPHRRVGLPRHGVRQAAVPADASAPRRRARSSRSAMASPTLAPGDRVVPYAALVCGTCRACMRGRENLCENVAGVRGFHVDGFAQELTNHPGAAAGEAPRRRRRCAMPPASPSPTPPSSTCCSTTRSWNPARWILVHAGGSGIGSIAIRIAKSLGCTVITTVGSDDKAAKARRSAPTTSSTTATDRFEGVVRKLTGKQGRRRGVRAYRRRHLERARCCR